MQKTINNQKKTIQSLRQKMDNLVASSVVVSMDNKLTDLLREVKQLKQHQRTLKDVNSIQEDAFQQLAGDTDYPGQVKRISEQIEKCKEQYRLLAEYRQTEELNFKPMFEALSYAEEQRFKLREQILSNKRSLRSMQSQD